MKGFQKVVCKVSAWALLLCSAMLMSFTSLADVQDDIVYFVVPDRFANGDNDNDLGGLTGDRSQTGYDPTDPRYFHGGDLKGLTSKLAYLRRLGVNAIWITPPFKNAVTSGSSAGYHGYWMKDYTQIDPHWGTNEEMAAFVALAKRYRIKVYFDVVVNHTADVIRYEECHNADGSLRDGLSNCPYRSLEEIESNPYTPFVPAGEENSKVPAWLNDTQYYNNQGDSTFSGESSVNGDFFGLDDLNTRDQFVVDGMIDIFKGWIDQFGIDGFRVDTVKHVDAELWRQWVPAIKAHAADQGNDDFFIFGEVFDGNPGTLAHYTRDLGFPSVLDFGMYFAFRDVLTGGQGTNRLADILSQDDLYTGTNAHAGQLMNFVSNHDVGRIGHFIQNMPGISEDEKLQRAKLAQSMIFMTRGIPVIYYGDEQGFTGDGGDAEGREDMFASQVPEYNDNNLIGTTKTTADDNFDTRHPVYMHIQQLSRMYKSYPELRRGANFVRYSQDTPGIFAFSRYDADRKREALVLFNTSTDTQSIELDVSGNAYAQAFPRGRGAVVPTDGKATFEIAPLSAVMWISDATISPSATVPQVTISSLQEGQTVADQVELIADLTDMDAGPIPLHQVHFAVSVDGGDFVSLGTDSVPQYRVQYDISGYPDGTELTFRATADNYGADNTSHQVTVTKGFIEGMRVIFRNDENADTPNIYYWNTTGNQPGVDWPGVPMTHLVGDYYEFQFEAGVTAANLIFNNNFGQTDNLYRTGDGCYIDGTWTDTCDLPGMEVFFQIPEGEEALWGTDINVYFWDAAPQAGVDWPGVPMELVSEGIYRFQFDNNVLAANLIFNGNGRQTENLYREKGGCFINNSQWVDACEADSEQPGMTVYFRRPLDWDVPNVHYWYDGGASTWPGEEMDALGDDWYSLQLPDGVTAANMVINDKTGGDGNQTGDLYREGDGCYDLATDTWTDSCATPGYTVYFRKPNDWDNAYAYFWATHPEDVANVGWPGEGMTELGADADPELGTWFTYQLPSGVKGSNIIFNNAGAPQTTDLSRTGDGCYTLTDGWSDTCEVPAPGMTVYFYKPDGFGDNINIHFWNVDGSPGWPGAPMQAIGDGWYSYTFEQGVTQANMLFHDNNGNQTTDLQRADGGCFGQYGDFWRKSCVVPTGVEVEIANRAAHLLTADTMAWQVSDNRAEDFRLYYSATASIATEDGAIVGEDGYITLTEAGDLDAALQAQDPHLASWTSFTLDDASQTADLLKGQLIAAAMDGSGNLLEATAVQFARALDDLYGYNGPLGVSYEAGAPSVTVWAPTAQAIELVLYNADGNQVSRHAADSVTEGAYTFNGEAGWDKLYYLFDVTVFHPFSGAIERYEVTDPYAVSLSENSQLSQFLDLEGDASLKPAGWDGVVKSLPEHQDISLYEGHVRDFSENDQSVPADHRGKYLAFTHNGVDGAELSNGMAHLIGLQQAGLSHFHLLPVFDISSIDENVDNRVDLSDPFSRLCAMSSGTAVQSRCADEGETPIRDVLTAMKENDPTTADIQAIVDAMNELDSFNWGYDPYHFNAPEGSYATATDGVTRVLEFREMVKALDEVDLNVVMDVVYNHTSASGLWSNSVLDRMVPGYYHRLNPISGGVENSTCCDNTATEHEMMEKLMVDTLVSWAKYFKIDSFRFDLMGHIPKSSMLAVKAALDTLTTATDGVEGDKIYLYGEGWDFGEVAGNQRFEQATQFNMAGTGIGTFNDRLRSAARGGNFTDSGRNQGWTSGNELFSNGYTTGGGLADQADRIRIGLAGNLQDYPFEDNGGSVNTGSNYGGVGYALDPQESVNYVDKHDNESLWDNTQAKLPDSMSADDRVRVHMLSNALINYGLGVPFYQMGTDLLRSKSLDRNTYNSGDWFNAVDFTMQDNNWASGLPLAQDNDSRWPTMADIINNGNISVTPAHIAQANAIFRNQLQVRYSTPLMRLADAQQVIDRVAFHNTGTGQLPGLIAMSISDGVCAGNDLDASYDGVVLMFNADDQELSFDIPELPDLELHPVLADGSDEVVKTASVSGATYTIPAHTAAVFVKPQGASQGEFPCNPQAAVENQPGMTVYFHNTDDWPEVRIHYWDTSPVAASTDWPGAELNVIGDGWYSYQFPNGVTAANVIFNNNNNGIQTNNLYREGDGCYVWQDADFTDSCVLPGIKVYFKKAADSDWSDDIHIHYWNSSPAPGTDWPGEQTTNLGDGWFFFQMPEGVRSANLIFNDADTGTGGQTTDLSRNKDGCYSFENGWLDLGHPECSPPEGL